MNAESGCVEGKKRARTWWILLGGLSLAAASGCGQKFTKCSDTRSCPGGIDDGNADHEEERGGEGGKSSNGGSGSKPAGGSSSGGDSGAGGSQEECAGGCKKGQTCCDGECVDTSNDVEHCGGCGKACEGAHAEYECVASKCELVSCEDGYVDCDANKAGCETKDEGVPGVPSPRLPVAGAYTGAVRAEKSLKPKFAWRPSGESGTCGGVTYELELTRECEPGRLQECAFDAVDVRVEGLEEPEWTPEEPLPVSLTVPVGAFYAWRVRACETKERCSAWSRVSYVNVGRLIDDINADGYSDVLEMANLSSSVFWSGDGATPLIGTMVGSDKVGPSTRGQFLGDVNGDGFPDMVLWADEEARVILGASAPSEWEVVKLSALLDTQHLGARVGDLDGDGFADVAISEFDIEAKSPTRGVVRLYRGNSSFSLKAPVNLTPPAGTDPFFFGRAMAGGLDANGDGLADLAILDSSDGLLHWVKGTPNFPSAITASVSAPAFMRNDFGSIDLVAIGDRNGDGYGDLAGYTIGFHIYVFDGGEEPFSKAAAEIDIGQYMNLDWAGGYDLGGDGYADLVFCSPFAGLAPSALPGSPGGAKMNVVRLGGLDIPIYLSVGDYDGDGTWDVVNYGYRARTLFLRGKPAPRTPDCPQPISTAPQIGDWCAVEAVTRDWPDSSGVYGSPVK